MVERKRTTKSLIMLAAILKESAFLETEESKAMGMIDTALSSFKESIGLEEDTTKKAQMQAVRAAAYCVLQ